MDNKCELHDPRRPCGVLLRRNEYFLSDFKKRNIIVLQHKENRGRMGNLFQIMMSTGFMAIISGMYKLKNINDNEISSQNNEKLLKQFHLI